MDKIFYEFIDVEIPCFNSEFFDLWLTNVVKHYKKETGSLTYIFVNDEYLLELNRTQLNHDFYTDIITFDFNELNSLSGDFFISYDRVGANALEFGNGFVFDELCRVMAHGILHLIGYNDKSTEGKLEMRLQEDFCLSLRQ